MTSGPPVEIRREFCLVVPARHLLEVGPANESEPPLTFRPLLRPQALRRIAQAPSGLHDSAAPAQAIRRIAAVPRIVGPRRPYDSATSALLQATRAWYARQREEERAVLEQERQRNPAPSVPVYRRPGLPPEVTAAIARAVARAVVPRSDCTGDALDARREDMRQDLAIKWITAREPVVNLEAWTYVVAKRRDIERGRKTARRRRLLEHWGPTWAWDEDGTPFGIKGDVETALVEWIDDRAQRGVGPPMTPTCETNRNAERAIRVRLDVHAGWLFREGRWRRGEHTPPHNSSNPKHELRHTVKSRASLYMRADEHDQLTRCEPQRRPPCVTTAPAGASA
jgi:hypothetical protein